MGSFSLLGKIRRGMSQPPSVIAKRLGMELRRTQERIFSRWRTSGCDAGQLLRATNATSIDELWTRLAARPYVSHIPQKDTREAARSQFCQCCRGGEQRILRAAERAVSRRVNLLGSGDLSLGEKIDWHRDYKTNHRWPRGFSADIDYCNFDLPSDVKFPWEVSRLQWLIPAGQAYCLTGDERYARATRDILLDWINENPPLHGVNWACTMEIALRILSWTWFFHVFHASPEWSDQKFRNQFLATLFTHGQFTEQFLEYSDINGNHCTADATGMVFAGLFFGEGDLPQRWQQAGWKLLCDELPRQVFPDGVNFEASLAYHRLVVELFLLPALYREKMGLDVPAAYRDRVVQMARFTQAYCRDDSSIPLIGDADDGRALPFGCQPINDHRYLLGAVGTAWRAADLTESFAGDRDEVFWLLGESACGQLAQRDQRPPQAHVSRAFPDGGFYVMANDRDHVFIDCGPVGLAGRGGHGHNDCLSFDAVLDGVHLVSDCGSYVYTASPRERNQFRSTSSHNTPCVNQVEINRFPADGSIWRLHDDARPEVYLWRVGELETVFRGSHSGYHRLQPPLSIIRTITLRHQEHSLEIDDEFSLATSSGMAVPVVIESPIHLAPGVIIDLSGRNPVLSCGRRSFSVEWEGHGNWHLESRPSRVSPSYGVALSASKLLWRYTGPGQTRLRVILRPLGDSLGRSRSDH